MGCKFCATGTLGDLGNLSAGEIVEQVAHGCEGGSESESGSEGGSGSESGSGSEGESESESAMWM